MRDAAAAEASGLPAAILLTRGVDGIAGETARISGFAELAILALRESLVGLSREEVVAAAAEVATGAAAAIA